MNALTRSEIASLDASVVRFELNGRTVEARADRTLIEIADAEGIAIPRLCYKAGLDKVGNCRSCMVEIAGERVLAPSCCRTPTDGMRWRPRRPWAPFDQRCPRWPDRAGG